MTSAAAVAFAAALTMACGKKGPPLPPIVHIPTSVDQVSARRVGNDVLVTLTVPAENVDKTKPADVGRIEVYGYTGTAPPPRGRFLDVAVLVATIPVRPPDTDATTTTEADPPDPPPPGTKADTAEAAPSDIPAAVQGASVTIRDHLTADALVPRPIPPAPVTGRERTVPPAGPPAPAAAVEGPLRRFYLALAFSPRGRVGPPGMVGELPLMPLPDPPLGVVATYAADAISLSWEPAGGVVGAILDHALPLESSPIDEPVDAAPRPGAPAAPDGPTRYNVYRDIEPAADPVPEPVATTTVVPAPVNGAPLMVLTFSEGSLLDGRRRCYTVRAVRGSGAAAVEGEASEPACVTPIDDVPPAPPAGLSTTTEPGAITLMWEPNVEDDLAGYVVLRGGAGDATLTPLTGSVTTEVRFVDRTVQPGVRYVYAVTAIDTRLPTPNVSAESVRVEETGR